MRVSTAYQLNSLSSHIAAAQTKLYGAQQKVITGKRFDTSAEDPTASRILVSMTGVKTRLEALSGNIRSGREYATLNESALTDIGDVMGQARQLGLQGNTATMDASARQALADQVDSLKSKLVSAGNTQTATGSYIFAGQNTDHKPFVVDGLGKVSYTGNTNPITVEAKPDELLQVNIPQAGDMILSIADTLDQLKSDILTGNTTTSLESIESLQKTVSETRGTNGVTLSQLARFETQNLSRIDDLTGQASDIQDVDLAQAMTDYQSAQTAYEAALRVTSTAQQLSLMDFLQ